MLYRERKRLLLAAGPIGGWVTVDLGAITINPDTGGVYNASRIAEIVQTDRDVILIRARLLPPVFNSCLVVRGTTATGAKVRVGVELRSRERVTLESVLLAAGFHVINRVTRFSLGAALARVED